MTMKPLLLCLVYLQENADKQVAYTFPAKSWDHTPAFACAFHLIWVCALPQHQGFLAKLRSAGVPPASS